MAIAMVGEIRVFPYNFYPQDWLPCDGRELSVGQYQILFAVIGTTYGGTYPSTFRVPNLQGRIPMGAGQGPGLTNRQLGVAVGTEGISLTSDSQLPAHTHSLSVQTLGYGQEKTAFQASPKAGISFAGRNFYNTSGSPPYSSYWSYNPNTPGQNPAAATPMAPSALSVSPGSSMPHENRQPYLPLTICICCDGEFPLRP